VRVSYVKLRRFIKGNPAYELNDMGDIVELIFHTPTLGEAAGSMDIDAVESSGIMRIIFKKEGDDLIIREVWVERAGARRRIGEDELESWITYIEEYY